jgi:CheY-like chemotaxis protein
MKVLVADDDPTTRTFLRQLLIRDVDCAVTEVEDGAEALAARGRSTDSQIDG